MEPTKDRGLEQSVNEMSGSVNEISGNPWYREEVDKLFSGVVISGLVGGALIAMYGHSIDKDFIKGIGYGMLYADTLIGMSIFTESYFRNRFFNKAIAKKSVIGGK